MKSTGYLCDTAFMPIFAGKRLEFVGIKMNEAERDQFLKIGADQDRAISYVVRELALRGLVMYLQDHKLKTTDEEIEIAREALNLDAGVMVAPTSAKKITLKTNEPEGKKEVA